MPNEIRKRGWMLMWLAFGVAALLRLSTTAQAQASAAAPPAGALIRMDMDSAVGVELDDIPAGAARETAAAWALSQGNDFWQKRASTQVNLTYYRLVFRSFFYTPPPARGDLPLPPHAVWRFEFLDQPRRTQIGTHDYVAIPYHFWTYIVTDPASRGSQNPRWAASVALGTSPSICPGILS